MADPDTVQYRVCGQRNVSAAYERFFAPAQSDAFERFYRPSSLSATVTRRLLARLRLAIAPRGSG